VLATMRRPEAENELAGMAGVKLLALDVTDPAQIGSTVAQAIAAGPVDVVFNNAGYGISGPLEGLTNAQIERSVQTNLMGPIRVTKAFIPHFRHNGRGLFINTTSIGGLITVPLNSVYHAAKWGLEGWNESMAFELRQV
jgi:NAD(P)-dependent dehydrogenase (short-subunit alcohol dehydrogenase family)